MLIPEVVIYNSIRNIVNFLKEDYKGNSDKSKSYLGLLLSDSGGIENYNFLEQADSVFGEKNDNPRDIQVNMFFNKKMANIPSVHLMMAGDGEQVEGEGIGVDEGYIGGTEVENDDDTVTYRNKFSRRYKGAYNIVITSDNSNEVLLLYNVLRACGVAITQSLNLAGIESARLSGSDINLNPDSVPNGVFARSLTLQYQYEIRVPSLFTSERLAKVAFQGYPSGIPDETDKPDAP